jgi:PAS domain S-box-containing protein
MVGASRRLSLLALLIVLSVAILPKLPPVSGALGGWLDGFNLAVIFLTLTSSLGVFLAARESRRRLALADLLHDERRMARRLRDSSASGVITADADLRITGYNPAMERMTGVKRGALLGQSVASSSLFPDSRHAESVRLALSGVETTLESSLWSNDRGPVQTRVYCSPVTAGKGRITGVLVIATDLRAINAFTDRPALESARSSESRADQPLEAPAA